MSIISEFKDFISKGNAFDLAIGVIVGGAFGPIVKSTVDDIIMPLVSIPLGTVDFGNLYLPLSPKNISAVAEAMSTGLPIPALVDAKALGSVLSYGALMNTFVNFFFIMLGVFLLVKAVNKLRRKKEELKPVAAEPTKEEILLTEIRDALRARP